MNHDDLCYDKNKRPVKDGDTIRINTCGSLSGEYLVTRGTNGELQIGGHDLFGFYTGTYEVLPNTPGLLRKAEKEKTT